MSLLSKILHLIRKFVLVVFSFILLFLLFLSALLFTHTGNQITIAIAEHFEPRLSIELKQGSFVNSPIFSKISWQDQQNQIEIDSVSYEFDWSCLFNKICLQRLDISNADIVIASSSAETETKSEEATSGEFQFPVAVALQAINLKNIHFSVDDFVIDLDSLHLQAAALNRDITLNSVIAGLTVTLPSKAEPTAKNATESTKIPGSLPAILSQQDLPEINLPFNFFVSPLKITDFTLKEGKQALLVVNSLNTQFNFQQSQLVIETFALDLPETDLQLAGDINFSASYPLNMQIKGQLKSIKQLQPADLLDGQIYDLKSYGDLSQLKTELLLSNKISLQSAAQLDLLEKNLPYRLTLNWQKLRWPLTGKVQYSSESGSLQSQGTLNDYRIKLDSVYSVQNIPDGELGLRGNGNLQAFNLAQLLVKTMDGTAKLNGRLSWQDIINWDGQLAIDKIDLAKLDTQYSGNFSGLIKQNVQISLKEQKAPSWKFTIPQMDINGKFLARPFAAQGVIKGDSKQGIAFKDLLVKNAKNKLTINGLLAKRNDLAIKLDIVDLSHVLIGSSGRINGELKIQGPKDALNIQSNLQGASLSYQNTKLNAFQLVSDAIVSDKPLLSLQLNAKKLTLDQQIIDDVTINVSNIRNTATINEHQLDLSVNSQPLSTQMSIQLIKEKQTWFSALSAATIDIPEQRLTLNKPFTVTFEDNDALVSPHCWQFSNPKLADTGEFCVNELNIGKQGKADLTIDNYLLTNLEPYLPEALKMAGALSANAQIKWDETVKPIINVNVFSTDMLVTVNDIEKTGNEAVTYPVEIFNIKFDSNQQKSDFLATVYSQNLIDTQIQGQLFPYQSKPLVNAVVDIELPDFSPFSVLVPELEKLQGRSKTQLTVTGPLSKPEISGQINITDTSINAVGLPIQINRLNSSIVIDNSSAIIDGEFYTPDFNYAAGSETRETLISGAVTLVDKSINKVRRVVIKDRSQEQQKEAELFAGEPGKVNIKGKLDWRNKLQGDIHFFANKMAVYEYDKFDLLVSPNLHLNFAEQIKLTGDVLVNRGKITVKDLPEGATSPSKDVIVVDIKDSKDTANLPIAVRLQLDLGQQLRVQALGLNSIVKGKLLIRKTTKKNPTIHGQLQLVDGSYRAFAQQLVLRKSQINFQGPIASPYISIEAIRDPNKIEDNVTAGVQVTGMPDQLSLEIFSEPAMAQQDALSYIIRGKSLQSSSDSQGNSQIASMLISISADKSADVMNKIGNKFGIKDLSLSASGSGDEQSVGVSGYIAPRVELSYGVGVFDSFSILAIRYEMFERFYIEASSGLEQAVDAYYEFDWD